MHFKGTIIIRRNSVGYALFQSVQRSEPAMIGQNEYKTSCFHRACAPCNWCALSRYKSYRATSSRKEKRLRELLSRSNYSPFAIPQDTREVRFSRIFKTIPSAYTKLSNALGVVFIFFLF